MANISKCRRCGVDILPSGRATNQRFCGSDCRETWWNEFRSNQETRSEVAVKILGTSQPTIPVWTDLQAAWLAGIVDGEGTIGIWRESRPANSSGKRFRAVLQVFNTNLDLLSAVRSLVSGNTALKRMEVPGKHKACYRVEVNRRAVLPVLRRIAPYLVAKKRQADLVMKFCEAMASAPVRASRVHDVFEDLWSQVKALNKRGATNAHFGSNN